MRGRRVDEREYSLLVDSGEALDVMKENMLRKDSKTFPLEKNFIMGNDRKQSQTATYSNYLKKKQLFHIVPYYFPLPEDGIIGLLLFSKYDRYAITAKFLIIEKYKLLLYDDGIYANANSMKINCIQTSILDKTKVWINKTKNIPEGMYQVRKGATKVPHFDYSKIQQLIEAPVYD